ncbi:MAG TPA: metal ABC transporter permease [Chloroflexia bacterium]|nr:metal ABC transporter permease [Chloroflexia bacterium]
MQTALLEMALLSVLVAVVGTFIVLQGKAFLALALSHGIFPGIVIAYLTGWDYLALSLIAGIIISLAVGLVGRNRRVGSDSAIAAIYTGTFAFGIVLVSSIKTFRGLTDILFGRPFATTWSDISLTGLTCFILLGLMLIMRKGLLLATFDRNMALAVGFPVVAIELGFLAIVAVSVITALPAVGNIQLVALLITAPATARLLTSQLVPMMLLAGLVSLSGSLIGLYAAYHFDLTPGSTIVAALTVLFTLALIFSPDQGLLARWLSRRATHFPLETVN